MVVILSAIGLLLWTAVPLAGYMAKHAPGDGSYRWVIEQGIEMGRPSRIEAEADVRDGRATAVRVGGRAVAVGRGTLTLPPRAEA